MASRVHPCAAEGTEPEHQDTASWNRSCLQQEWKECTDERDATDQAGFPIQAGALAASLLCILTLDWLKHLLERLGSNCALAAWQSVHQDYDDALLRPILSSGWMDVPNNESVDADERIAAVFAERFPTAIAGVSPDKARQLVEKMPPILQIRQTFSSF